MARKALPVRVRLPALRMPAHKLAKKEFSWTPELAYVVGLITTDGSLSKDKRHITFTSTDMELIRTFKKCLKIGNKITKTPKSNISKKQVFRVQFGNVQFYNWLCTIGLSSNKTSHLSKMSIPDKYFSDFVRGHLDGDGSIITYEDKYNTDRNPKYIYQRLMVYLMSASRLHIIWLQKKITRLTNLKGAIQIKKYPQRKRSCYVLKFSKKESISLFSWIYYKNNLPLLKRKYKIAQKYLI